MTEAIDFTKVNSKGYKAWRIVSASGSWAQIYREREKELRGYKSAIIFPEQLIGLNQNIIYKVVVVRTGQKVDSHITAIRNFQPQGARGEQLNTLEQIREYETENSEPGGSHRISVGKHAGDSSFYNFAWFSSQKDAIKYQAKEQAKCLSQIG